MAERTLIAKVRPDADHPDTLMITSPVVGMAEGAPRTGTFVNRFDRVISVKILGRRHALRLPRDVEGRVVESYLPEGIAPIAYDAPLIRIDPRASAGAAATSEAAASDAATDPAGENVVVVSSPSVGIFYRRPSPDSPPYVEAGSPVSQGTVLGLVEVMKCFNQIAYGGPGLPESGEVVRILAEDTSEVEFGQPLFWIKPGT
jgi:biotin carboxyl carrier protein